MKCNRKLTEALFIMERIVNVRSEQYAAFVSRYEKFIDLNRSTSLGSPPSLTHVYHKLTLFIPTVHYIYTHQCQQKDSFSLFLFSIRIINHSRKEERWKKTSNVTQCNSLFCLHQGELIFLGGGKIWFKMTNCNLYKNEDVRGCVYAWHLPCKQGKFDQIRYIRNSMRFSHIVLQVAIYQDMQFCILNYISWRKLS